MSRPQRSDQEVLLKQLSERSMAAPFVFIPDHIRGKRSQNQNEPVDLVWACNNCVILMYMTASDCAAEKAIKHNRKQAEFFIKEWKRGKLLTGRNAWHKFTMRYGSALHVIVLSVVKHNGIVSFHDDAAKKLGVTCCATVPQIVIERLVAMGGSSYDLIWELKIMRDAWLGSPIPEKVAIQFLNNHREDSKTLLKLDTFWPGERSSERWLEVARLIASLRHSGMVRQTVTWPPVQPSSTTPHLSVDMVDLDDVLNDLLLTEFYKLVSVLRGGIDLIQEQIKKSTPLHPVSCITNLLHYDCCIIVSPNRTAVGDVEKLIRNLYHHWCKWYMKVEKGTIRHGPLIKYELQGEVSIFAVMPRPYPSATEAFLTKWWHRPIISPNS